MRIIPVFKYAAEGGKKGKHKWEDKVPCDNNKVFLFQLNFYGLVLILWENQEINSQGTNIYGANNAVRTTGVTENYVGRLGPRRAQNIFSLNSRWIKVSLS